MKRIAPILIALLLVTSPAWCAISYINTWMPTTSGSTTINTGLYGSAAVGDVYVMPWTYSGTVSPTTGFDGWGVLGASHNSALNIVTQIWYKVVTSADVGKTYTFGFSGAANAAGGIMAFRGVNNSAPVDAFSFHNDGSGSTVTADSITPAGGDALVWIAGGYLAANQRFNPPSGYGGGITVGKQYNTWAETAAIKLGVPAQPTGPVNGSSQFFSDLWETALVSLTAGAAPPPTATVQPTGFPPSATPTKTSIVPPTPSPTPTSGGPPVPTATATPAPVPTPPTGGPYLAVSPTATNAGGIITITWANIPNPMNRDWVGLYPVGAGPYTYLQFQYMPGTSQGTTTMTIGGSVVNGNYEIRYWANNAFTNLVATSNPFSVGNPAQTPAPTHTPGPTWTPKPTNTPNPSGTPTTTPIVATVTPQPIVPTATAPAPAPTVNPVQPDLSASYSPNCGYDFVGDNVGGLSAGQKGIKNFRCWGVVYQQPMPTGGYTGQDQTCTLSNVKVAAGDGVTDGQLLPHEDSISIGTTTTATFTQGNPNGPTYIDQIFRVYTSGISIKCFYSVVGGGKELQITAQIKNIGAGQASGHPDEPYISAFTASLIPMRDGNEVPTPLSNGVCSNNQGVSYMGSELTANDSLRGIGGPLIYPLRYLSGAGAGVRFLLTTADADLSKANALTYGLGNKCSTSYSGHPIVNAIYGWRHRAYLHHNKNVSGLTGCRHYTPNYEYANQMCDQAFETGKIGSAMPSHPTCNTYQRECEYETLGPIKSFLAQGQTTTITAVLSAQPDNPTVAIGAAPSIQKYHNTMAAQYPMRTFWTASTGQSNWQKPIAPLFIAAHGPTSNGLCCGPRFDPTIPNPNPHFYQANASYQQQGFWNPIDNLSNGTSAGLSNSPAGWEENRDNVLHWASDKATFMSPGQYNFQGSVIWDVTGAEYTDMIEYAGPPTKSMGSLNGAIGSSECAVTPHFPPNTAPYNASPASYNATYYLPKEMGFKHLTSGCDGDDNVLKELFTTLRAGGLKTGTLINASQLNFDAGSNVETRVNPDTWSANCNNAEYLQAWNNIKARMDLLYYYGARMFYGDAIAGAPMSAPCLMEKLYQTYTAGLPSDPVLFIPEERSFTDYNKSIPYEDLMNYNNCSSQFGCAFVWGPVFPWESTPGEQARWIWPNAREFLYIGLAASQPPCPNPPNCAPPPINYADSDHGHSKLLWQLAEKDLEQGAILGFNPGYGGIIGVPSNATLVGCDLYAYAHKVKASVPDICNWHY